MPNMNITVVQSYSQLSAFSVLWVVLSCSKKAWFRSEGITGIIVNQRCNKQPLTDQSDLQKLCMKICIIRALITIVS